MIPILAAIVASTAGTIVKLVFIPVIVAALTAIVTLVVTRVSDAANRRRDRYADAVATLVAWIELPYRVRRRTDNSPEALTALANRGHEMQEKLACHEAWISTENSDVAAIYADARKTIGAVVGAALQEAWNGPAITTPGEMNLGEWGPAKACAPSVTAVQAAITTRFGWQRVRNYLPRSRDDVPCTR
jgi:hypothetical protein